MIHVGAIWERVGPKWNDRWRNAPVIITEVDDDEIHYRYPASSEHDIADVSLEYFLRNFKLLEEP